MAYEKREGASDDTAQTRLISSRRSGHADHLRDFRWQKGQSGNPAGRPKRPSFEALVQSVLDQKLPESDESNRETLARLFVGELLDGNRTLMREFLLRVWPIVNKHNIETTTETADRPDLSKLSNEELVTLKRILMKAQGLQQPEHEISIGQGQTDAHTT